jgi:uncharacterized membrane protein YfcA
MEIFTGSFFIYVAIGFAAQLVDGALGMAFGLICATSMLVTGLPPVTVSAAVHAAEVFTTAASGISHFSFKNIDRSLFFRLVIPGVIGGVIGAYLLSNISGEVIRPFIISYLVIMGGVILARAIRKELHRKKPPKNPKPFRYTTPLGFFGGLFDAIGGGGWGPIVTTNLIVRGESPRHVIGTVSLAEFFLTLSVSAVFIMTGGLVFSKVILGLLVGGVVAAPLAAYLVRYVPERILMGMVGVIIICSGLYQLWFTFAQ